MSRSIRVLINRFIQILGSAAKIIDDLVLTMTKNDKSNHTASRPQIANLILLG